MQLNTGVFLGNIDVVFYHGLIFESGQNIPDKILTKKKKKIAHMG